MNVRPKKALGQHFLKDQNIARKIVDSLDESVKGGVLEVGPGTGVLSAYLFEKYPDVHLIEVDEEAWGFLQERYPEHAEKILLGNFLKSDLFSS